MRIDHDPLSAAVIGAAIEVHRHLGPSLFESAYEECLAWELEARGVQTRRQVANPVVYKGVPLDVSYRVDRGLRRVRTAGRRRRVTAERRHRGTETPRTARQG